MVDLCRCFVADHSLQLDMLHVRRDIAEDLNRYFGTRYTIIMSTFVHPWFQYVFNCYTLYARGITTFGPVERDLSSKVAKNFHQHVSWRLNTTMQASQNTTIYQNITITIESLIQEAVYKVYTAAFAIGLYYMYGLWVQNVRLRLSHSVNRLTTLVPKHVDESDSLCQHSGLDRLSGRTAVGLH